MKGRLSELWMRMALFSCLVLGFSDSSLAQRKAVVVFIIDGDFVHFEGHGAIVRRAVRAYFNGPVEPLDAAEDSSSFLDPTRIATALTYIVQYSASHPNTAIIVNMSYGSHSYNPAMSGLLAALTRFDVAFIAAAGNDDKDGCNQYPAAYPGVISVGSVMKVSSENLDRGQPKSRFWGHLNPSASYKKASYSNYGPCVQIAASDEDLSEFIDLFSEAYGREKEEAALLGRDLRKPEEVSQRFEYLLKHLGTSFAAPQVSGVLARVLQDAPDISVAEGIRAIRGSGIILSDDSNWHPEILSPYSAMKVGLEIEFTHLNALSVTALINRSRESEPKENLGLIVRALGQKRDGGVLPALAEILNKEGHRQGGELADALVTQYQSGSRGALSVLVGGLRLRDHDYLAEFRDAAPSIGEPAIKPLLNAARNSELREDAISLLIALGEIGVPSLIRAFKDPDASVRSAATDAIRGEGNRSVVPLIAALKSGDEAIRSGALNTLPAIKISNSTDLFEPLSSYLADENITVRQWAAWALSENARSFGEAAGVRTVPTLIHCIEVQLPEVSKYCAYALDEVGDERAMSILKNKVRSGDNEFRQIVSEAMSAIEARERLHREVQSQELRVHREAQSQEFWDKFWERWGATILIAVVLIPIAAFIYKIVKDYIEYNF